MSMFENFPYTDLHNLNLDWIIKIAKDFLDQYTSLQQMIADGEQSLTDLTQEGLNDLQEKADTLQGLLDAWYTEHSTDIANQLADALADIQTALNSATGTIGTTLSSAITAFNHSAEQKAQETIATIPDDYTALADSVAALKSAPSTSFSVTTWTDSSYLDSNGAVQSLNSSSVSNFVDVSGYQELTIHARMRRSTNICGYDENYQKIYNYINTGSDPETVDITFSAPNLKYVRISAHTDSRLQTTITGSIKSALSLLEFNRNPIQALKAAAWTDSSYLDSYGVPQTLSNSSISDFIDVSGYQEITVGATLRNNTNICGYDKDQHCIYNYRNTSGADSFVVVTINMPNMKYIRISCKTPEINNVNITGAIKTALAILQDRKDNQIVLPLTGQANHYVHWQTGAVTYINSVMYASDLIKLNTDYPIKIIFNSAPPVTGAEGIAFYREDGVYDRGIHYDGTTSVFTAPAGMCYMRLTYYYDHYPVIIQIGENSVAYELNQMQTKIEKYADTLYQTFKTMGIIGDSLASGECYSNNGGVTEEHDMYDFAWGTFIAKRYDATCHFFSAGGMTTRSWFTNAQYGYAKASDGQHDCDVYYVALGQNDYSKPDMGMDYLGSIADIDTANPDNNEDTFYGNYAKIIQKMQIVQPKAKFFCLKIPQYGSVIDATKEAFNDAIDDICELLSNAYPITIDGPTIGRAYPWSNRRAGHFNATGYNYISNMITEAVNKYMYQHPEEFTQVEFIGTDYSWT